MKKKRAAASYPLVITTETLDGETTTCSPDKVSDEQYIYDCHSSSATSFVTGITLQVNMAFALKKLFVLANEFSSLTVKPGYYNSGSAILECPTGTFNSANGLVSKCSDCPVNQYQSKNGQVQCDNCPEGQFTAEEGSTVCASCSDPGNENEPLCATGDAPAYKTLRNLPYHRIACEAEEDFDTKYGNYTWPKTVPGNEITLPCAYNVSPAISIITIALSAICT
eukprot:sb/3469702/